LTDSTGKRLELLRDILPALKRVAILFNAANPLTIPELEKAEAAARTLGVETIRVEVRRAEDIQPAIDQVRDRADALYVCIDPFVNTNGMRINSLALAARLPTMHSSRDNIEAGGMISYALTSPTCSGAPASSSTRSCAEQSPVRFRSNSRSSSNWSSISRQPGRLALRSRRRCSRGPTKSSSSTCCRRRSAWELCGRHASP